MLQHVTNPLTQQRGHEGKDMPIVTFDLLDDADYVEITGAASLTLTSLRLRSGAGAFSRLVT